MIYIRADKSNVCTGLPLERNTFVTYSKYVIIQHNPFD